MTVFLQFLRWSQFALIIDLEGMTSSLLKYDACIWTNSNFLSTD